ncbi:hypothetical protein LCGC14_0718200 [marine sediment metagenome]|uniref:Uncharacterized protein n=1 Tax=marine sediment metagenome TaxID=412755 RepID=A0A0F9TKM5_9ZZZZ
MVIYADLLREALEPPVVKIGGRSHQGKILSHAQFLRHEEALYVTLQTETDEASSFGAAREQIELVKDFLEEIFPPPPIPHKPKEPKQPNIFEKIWYWLSGHDPKRWHIHVEILDTWDVERGKEIDDYIVNQILAHPNVFQIVAELFTCQRRVWNTEQHSRTNKKQSSEDSSKDPSLNKTS